MFPLKITVNKGFESSQGLHHRAKDNIKERFNLPGGILTAAKSLRVEYELDVRGLRRQKLEHVVSRGTLGDCRHAGS
jgi:hypothetical protein